MLWLCDWGWLTELDFWQENKTIVWMVWCLSRCTVCVYVTGASGWCGVWRDVQCMCMWLGVSGWYVRGVMHCMTVWQSDWGCLDGVVSEEMYSVCICDWVCLVGVSEELYTVWLPDCLAGGVWLVWCLKRCTVYAYVTGCVWFGVSEEVNTVWLIDCLTGVVWFNSRANLLY